MTVKTKCECSDDMTIGIEHELTDPNHYDGVSEWLCRGCGNRVGRWSGKLLGDGESERRFAAPYPEEDPVKCPACDGKKKVLAFGIRYAEGHDGPLSKMLPCHTCGEKGEIAKEQVERMKRGGMFRAFRSGVLQLGLREASEAWGMRPSHLSLIERGAIESDWKPPGFDEGKAKAVIEERNRQRHD